MNRALGRRPFLAISAAFTVACPFAAQPTPVRWRGFALGAVASIEIRGPGEAIGDALEGSRRTLRDVERLFSLYDPTSTLARLNAEGEVVEADLRFHQLIDAVGRLHTGTEGRFDPTIQPLWRALAEGGDARAARARIGWERVGRTAAMVRLGRGQTLTLNGIAQGFATDLVAAGLRAAGAEKVLVNIGEFAGLGGPWRLGIADPAHGMVAVRSLTNGAIATSSPGALLLAGDTTHILDPRGEGRPRWSTVSVEAESATLADGLSTALCHADLSEISRIAARLPDVRRVVLVDAAGRVITL